MPNTNGHGAKRAILYARVSTDEQARSGYSLAQQIEALRAHAAREGYEVLEEVSDPGERGASLERPGMDRVRDLVAAGGVSAVLAQDRDRFSREPAYLYLLREEFTAQGTRIKSLNDRGDDSPEGQLTDGILDQLAKFERAKTADLIGFDELRERLTDLEDARKDTERTLEATQRRAEHLEHLEQNRNVLLEQYAGAVPEVLGALAPEERHRVYRIMRLRAVLAPSGDLEMSGDVMPASVCRTAKPRGDKGLPEGRIQRDRAAARMPHDGR
jgi:predicted site-specific integrase-resolvase